MLVDIAVATSCVGAGLACGWVMHAIGGFGNYQIVSIHADKDPEGRHGALRSEQVQDVAKRLKSFADSMAADVDQHQSRVQEISHSLQDVDGESENPVVDPVARLIEANEKMQHQLQDARDRIHEQTLRIESAERRAETDALTRVPNRGAFDRHLASRHALGPGQAGSLAVLDVDHFKKFNDVYGHRAGDQVLRVVAGVLHSRLHQEGIVARYGGEEFVVVFDGCPVEIAAAKFEAVRRDISAREIMFEGKRLCVTASGGVSELMTNESPAKWLQRADDGLYHSKENGRDCAHWMDGDDPVPVTVAATPAPPSGQATPRRTASLAGLTDDDAPSRTEPAEAEANRSEPILHDDNGVDDDGDDEATDKPERASGFAYLPDRESLAESYDDTRLRTQSGVTILLMAIRCPRSTTEATLKSLLQIVRATLRGVDKLGCDDDETLLICMPSIDVDTAMSRANQIRKSAKAVGMELTDEDPLAVGIVEADAEEAFDQVVERVRELSDSLHATEPIRVQPSLLKKA